MSTDKKNLPEQPTGPKYKYKRLYDLGADRIGIIDSMLTNGDSPMSVAERIKYDWNECASVKIATLDKQILRYRNEIVEPKLRLAAERADVEGTAITVAMKKFKEQVDVMVNLSEAINMQRTRIHRAYAKEEMRVRGGGKPDPAINKELRAFTDMCRVLAGLQLETGVVRRVPKQIQGFFQNLDTKQLAEFQLEMTQNDDTLKALGQLTEVLQEAHGEIIDGEYVPVDSESSELPTGDEQVVDQTPH